MSAPDPQKAAGAPADADTAQVQESAATASAHFKGRLKALARAAARPLLPVIERSWSLAAAAAARRRGVRVIVSDRVTKEMNEALDHLPAPEACTRDHYRALLEPTDTPKRHILALEGDAPIALVSVRQRGRAWEPVAYQALPGFFAPAIAPEAIGRAVRAAGLYVRMAAGLDESAQLMGGAAWTYPFCSIELQEDYEAYWKDNPEHQNLQYRLVKEARKKTAKMRIVVDGEGDMDWAVERWRAIWANDADGEVCAAPDRLRFWKALQASPREVERMHLHSIALYDGDACAACAVVSEWRGVLLGQVLVRAERNVKAAVGTGALDATMRWAASRGMKRLDMGGGGYKSQWGPETGVRFGVEFCPRPIGLLKRLDLYPT